MTAITPDAWDTRVLQPVSVSRIQGRLGELVKDRRGLAGWWVDVTRQLDSLGEAVLGTPVDGGMGEQFRYDAPHLVARWQHLSVEREDLYEEVAQVRLLAGRNAGDPLAVGTVIRAIQDVVARVRRFQERTSAVLLDAYERDFGGE